MILEHFSNVTLGIVASCRLTQGCSPMISLSYSVWSPNALVNVIMKLSSFTIPLRMRPGIITGVPPGKTECQIWRVLASHCTETWAWRGDGTAGGPTANRAELGHEPGSPVSQPSTCTLSPNLKASLKCACFMDLSPGPPHPSPYHQKGQDEMG